MKKRNNERRWNYELGYCVKKKKKENQDQRKMGYEEMRALGTAWRRK